MSNLVTPTETKPANTADAVSESVARAVNTACLFAGIYAESKAGIVTPGGMLRSGLSCALVLDNRGIFFSAWQMGRLNDRRSGEQISWLSMSKP